MRESPLSCFYYVGNGERCQVPCLWPMFFCATHMVEMQRVSPKELFRQAAEAVWACTSLAESGLPLLSCRDVEKWGRLANCLTGLSLHGYRDDNETLTVLLSSLLALDSPWRKQLKKLPARSTAFELLVARLYLQELAAPLEAVRKGQPLGPTQGVRVLWDQKVESSVTSGKRQVDVLIRWYRGAMSDVFTAVECKDTEVEISEVEAFATKLKTIGAHNGVIVSSVGFQSGAIETAQAFGVTLRVITEDDLTTDTVTEFKYLDRLRPRLIFLEPPDGRQAMPLTPPASQYKIVTADGVMPIVDRVDSLLASALPVLGAWPPVIEEAFTDARLVFSDGRSEPLAMIYIQLQLEQPLERVVLEKPRRPRAFSVRDIMPPAVRTLSAEAVRLRPAPSMQPGMFYTNFFCQAYYCTAVSSDEIRFVLLGDKQHGTVLDVEGSQSTEYAHHYYPIEDPVALHRLAAALERFKQLPGSPEIPPVDQ